MNKAKTCPLLASLYFFMSSPLKNYEDKADENRYATVNFL